MSPLESVVENEKLTAREIEVLRAVGSFNYKGRHDEVCKRLKMGKDTIKNHLRRIHEKLGVHETPTAVYFGLENGFLRLEDLVDDVEVLKKSLSAVTNAERELLEVISVYANKYGMCDDKSLARGMNLELQTIKNRKINLRSKTGTSNSTQLAVVAYAYVKFKSEIPEYTRFKPRLKLEIPDVYIKI